jgi:TetR/AcrR family transcriptional repressor of nem operon
MRDTRAALLSEAEILIRGRGYSGFSYADLSSAVGIRKASIHHHFPTKTDLAVALLEAYRARYAGSLDAILAASEDGIARIDAYAAFYLQGVERGLGCLCAALAAELETLPVALRADLAAFFEAHVAWLERVLREGQANGTIRAGLAPAAAARMIIATLEGALMMERVAAGPDGFGGMMAALRASLR